MNVRLVSEGGHVAWQVGELVTVKIVAGEGDAYECETVETFAPNLKETHAAALQAAETIGEQRVQELQDKHARQLQLLGVSPEQLAATQKAPN